MGRKKRGATAEADRLRLELVAIIDEIVQPTNPKRAAELRAALYLTDPNDDISDIGDNDDDDGSEAGRCSRSLCKRSLGRRVSRPSRANERTRSRGNALRAKRRIVQRLRNS